ncbi:MAG: hypothetical protein WC804_14435 [Sphingomonas sp.]|uniref:hypothetical protein n=1 Tax=Sphingomonas sp. TaxID=28214 RepID=UPI003568A7AA
MRRLDQPELRFLILRGLQRVPPGTLKDMHGSSDARHRALAQATDIILERLSHLEYEAPEPIAPHGWPTEGAPTPD